MSNVSNDEKSTLQYAVKYIFFDLLEMNLYGWVRSFKEVQNQEV